MKPKIYFALFLTGLCLAFQSDQFMGFNQPAHFPEPEYDFSKNPLLIAFELSGNLLLEEVNAKNRKNIIMTNFNM